MYVYILYKKKQQSSRNLKGNRHNKSSNTNEKQETFRVMIKEGDTVEIGLLNCS